MSKSKKYYLLEKGIDEISKDFFKENILLKKKWTYRKVIIQDKKMYDYYFKQLEQKYNQEELDYILLLLREDRELYLGGWNRLLTTTAMFIAFIVGYVPLIELLNGKEFFDDNSYLWGWISFSAVIVWVFIYAFSKETKYIRRVNRYNRMIEIIEFYNKIIKNHRIISSTSPLEDNNR